MQGLSCGIIFITTVWHSRRMLCYGIGKEREAEYSLLELGREYIYIYIYIYILISIYL